MTQTRTITGISLEVAKGKAPAIFAESPAPTIKSAKYQFTPTFEVISHMESMGYVLTAAKQSLSGVELRKNYGTHICHFQHPDLYIKDTMGAIEAFPQIVLLNSHDGTRPIQFEMGIFRLVCSNGLIVKAQDMGSFRERHTRYSFQEVKDLIDSKVADLTKTVGKINNWSMIEMSETQRRAFATAALQLRTGSDRVAEAHEISDILYARREADKPNTLWHTFNRVQESIIKGGFTMNNRTARAIKNPVEDLTLNQGIWQLAEQYAI